MPCEHEPVVEPGKAHDGCRFCGIPPTQAPMDKIIAVGFGAAFVSRDGEQVLDGERRMESAMEGEGGYLTFADAERLAVAEPDHDWRVTLHGPLHGETYQRQGPEVWLCIERNDGFA